MTHAAWRMRMTLALTVEMPLDAHVMIEFSDVLVSFCSRAAICRYMHGSYRCTHVMLGLMEVCVLLLWLCPGEYVRYVSSACMRCRCMHS